MSVGLDAATRRRGRDQLTAGQVNEAAAGYLSFIRPPVSPYSSRGASPAAAEDLCESVLGSCRSVSWVGRVPVCVLSCFFIYLFIHQLLYFFLLTFFFQIFFYFTRSCFIPVYFYFVLSCLFIWPKVVLLCFLVMGAFCLILYLFFIYYFHFIYLILFLLSYPFFSLLFLSFFFLPSVFIVLFLSIIFLPFSSNF